MYKAAVYNHSNIPSHLRHLLEEPASAVLVIEHNDSVVNYFLARASGGILEVDLIEVAEEMQRAYALNDFSAMRPTNRECALIAHRVADGFRRDGMMASNPLEEKRFYNEARKYDDVCDRFLKGLVVSVLHSDEGDIIAYLVKGDSGYAYSLNASANSCTCHVGRNSTEICWHMRAIECFTMASKYNERD